MNTYKETIDTWNKIAGLYQEKFMDLDLYDKTYDLICNALRENATLLDVGCGPGNITRYLLSKRPDLRVTGIDAATNMIVLARQNNPSATFMEMDCREIKTIESKFDAIVGGFCLPYLSTTESEKFINDSFHLLTDDGFFYASFVAGEPEQSGFKTGSNGDRVYFYYHSTDTLKKKLLESGFEKINIVTVDYKRSDTEKEIHTIVTAKKDSSMQSHRS